MSISAPGGTGQEQGRGPGPDDDGLAFVDEHSVLIDASADEVWQALTAAVAAPRSRAVDGYARLVGAEPLRRGGAFPQEGSSLPGFKVAEAVPGHVLRLTGRHRFSRYEFAAFIDVDPDPTVAGTRLIARTRAVFPGLGGSVYRGLVIRSGAHRVLVPRLLRGIRRRAEGGGSGRSGADAGTHAARE